MNVLILMIGLPRSGKSTIAQHLTVEYNAPIVCPDAIRIALHGEQFIAQAERQVWTTAHYMVEALFLAGHTTVILDATNTTVERRKEWRSKKWLRTFCTVETTADVCKERAFFTSPDPEKMLLVIDKMAAEFEPVTDEEFVEGEKFLHASVEKE